MRRRSSPRFLIRAAACAAAFVVACAAPCAAQVDAGLDAAVSVVKYDGYLVSGAAALTPSVSWRSARSQLGARGTVLLFESGNANIQGLLTAGTFSRPLGPLRVEAAAEASASVYASFARFASALARMRVHYLGGRWGLWAGPLGGQVSRGDVAGRGAWGASAGWWAEARSGAAAASWMRITAGDTAYSDVQGRARWRSGGLVVEGAIGTRVASRGGGHGAYGDLSVTVRLADWLALVVAGGSYPSDPVRGSIPGRYATVGVRFAPRPAPQTVLVSRVDLAVARLAGPSPETGVPSSASGGPARVAAEVAVEQRDGLALLVVRAPGARRVEVMGDFTGWQPVGLASSGEGRYRYALGLPPGMHRFNLRVDGGAWGVPVGAGTAADEFGGSVGVVVIP